MQDKQIVAVGCCMVGEGKIKSGASPKYIVAYPPVDFARSFSELRPEEIDIYFHYTNVIGGATCKAACAQCYFRNRPTFHVEARKALAITEALRLQGYNIGLTPADSFASEALMTGDAGSAFRLKSIGTSAWSSGVPLYLPGWEGKLDRAWKMGFRSIIISAHEAAGTFVPFTGVAKASVIRQAIRNIGLWNKQKSNQRFSVAVTFTIRADNCELELMRKMVAWGVAEGIDLVRFNCFANFQRLAEHAPYEMTRQKIVDFYGCLAKLQQEFLDSPTSLGISEDWGDAGIEQIYPWLPSEWQSRSIGWCRAGYRLFAMIEVDSEIVLTGCVDKWDPVMGKVVEGKSGSYSIQWDYKRIETLRQAVLGNQVYACWGGVGLNREEQAGFNANRMAEQTLFAV